MIDETARRLIKARRTHHAALAATACPPDAQAAYAAQDAVARAFGWFGDEPARHWKSGGPSREAVLTHASLPPDGVWSSPAESGAWPFNLRGIEAEVALRLARDVDPEMAMTLDGTQAAALVDAMCVSIEVVDSRWVEGLDAAPLAKLADLHSRMVPWCSATGLRLRRETGMHSRAVCELEPGHRSSAGVPIRYPIRLMCSRPGCVTPRGAVAASRRERWSPPAPGWVFSMRPRVS